jgi:hypothetical protein
VASSRERYREFVEAYRAGKIRGEGPEDAEKRKDHLIGDVDPCTFIYRGCQDIPK